MERTEEWRRTSERRKALAMNSCARNTFVCVSGRWVVDWVGCTDTGI